MPRWGLVCPRSVPQQLVADRSAERSATRASNSGGPFAAPPRPLPSVSPEPADDGPGARGRLGPREDQVGPTASRREAAILRTAPPRGTCEGTARRRGRRGRGGGPPSSPSPASAPGWCPCSRTSGVDPEDPARLVVIQANCDMLSRSEPLLALAQRARPAPLGQVAEVDGEPLRGGVGVDLVPAVVGRVEDLERDADALVHRPVVREKNSVSDGRGELLPDVPAEQVAAGYGRAGPRPGG